MSFKVGDVCVIVAPGKPNHGCEVTILGPYVGTVITYDGEKKYVDGYDVSTENLVWSRPAGMAYDRTQLRLKRPPSKDDFTAGDWELCPWRPERVKG